MKNQDILAKLVDREVKGLASDIVAKLDELSNGDFTLNADTKFLYEWPCPKCGEDTGGDRRLTDEDNIHSPTESFCRNCDWTDENEPESEIKEVLEWYFVSSWFAEKLEEQGEVVIRDFHLPIWGRQTSGQAILLDSVIEDIAEEMEILEGQKYEWKS